MDFSKKRVLFSLAFVALIAAGCGESSSSGDENTDTQNPGQSSGEKYVVVDPTTAFTSENGDSVDIHVKLSQKPAGTVVINVQSLDTTEGTVSLSSLTFTEDNWNSEQIVTITGVDDDEADTDIIYYVEFKCDETATEDKGYVNQVFNVWVTNIDNDLEGVDRAGRFVRLHIDADDSISEDGKSVQYGMNLKAMPSDDVIVKLIGTPATEGKIEPSTLVFTQDNWGAVQYYTITGLDDNEEDGNQLFKIEYEFSSKDIRFDKLQYKTSEIVNLDNDTTPGLHVLSESLVTDEFETKDSFFVGLDNKPAKDVFVYLESTRPDEAITEHSIVRLTSENYSMAEVFVQGVDDDKTDGPQDYQIKIRKVGSSDPSYNNIKPYDMTSKKDFEAVAGINEDNDRPEDKNSIIVTPVTQSSSSPKKRDLTPEYYTSEDGDSVSFTTTLEKPPKDGHAVIINVIVTDPTEAITDPSSLYFDSKNWNIPQEFSVIGVDDDEADGDVVYGTHLISVSTDYACNVLESDVLVMQNNDNEPSFVTSDAGLVIERSHDVLYTNEDGQSRTFNVSLNSQPSASVVVTSKSSDESEGVVVSGKQLVFTPLNWNIPQSVMVMGLDDNESDGNVNYSVNFTIDSDDNNYAALNSNDDFIYSSEVLFLNFDNEDGTQGSSSGPSVVVSDLSSCTGNSCSIGSDKQPFFSFSSDICSNQKIIVSPNQPFMLYVHLNEQPADKTTVTFEIENENAAAFKEGKGTEHAIHTFSFTPENYNVDKSVGIYSKNTSGRDMTFNVSVRSTSNVPDDVKDELCSFTVVAKSEDVNYSQGNTQHLRIMAANTTTGAQVYEDVGMNMFYAMDPDVILAQEFAPSAEDVIQKLSSYFGAEYHYVTGKGRIGNGIISKYPIIWHKSHSQQKIDQYSNQVVYTFDSYGDNADRQWDAALIDIPGDKDLLALSLHLSTKHHYYEFPVLHDWIKELMAGHDYYLVIGGDFNTSNYSDGLSQIGDLVVTQFDYPRDKYNENYSGYYKNNNGAINTNHNRNKHYDWVLVDPAMHAQSVPTRIGADNYAFGYVLDSRYQLPISAIAPVKAADCENETLQHMPVIRDFIYEY